MKIPLYPHALFDYEIFPRVALLGTPCSFEVRGLGIETAFEPGREYTVSMTPQEQNNSAKLISFSDYNRYDTVTAIADEKGILRFTYTFTREQVYNIAIGKKDDNGNTNFFAVMRVFCAKEDLFSRTPMRGNTHCHVCESVDGYEDPYLASALYRKAGYDYLAITDHHKVDGSLIAIEAAEKIPSEIALYIGEEVHVPNAYIHAINVGTLMPGNVGLDKWYHDHEEEINAEVAKTAEEWKDKLPAGIEPLDFAWRKWIADTIHKGGGIAIMAHPMWEWQAHNTPDDMFRYLAEQKIYDAVEAIHGQEPGCTDANMQVAFWNDLRADGIFITPVGVDDAHRRNHNWDYECSFNEAYTIIFANDPSFSGFAEAIKGGYSVAVETYENAPNHVVGTYRLTKFAIFLLENYFPYHDELCFEEGNRMRDCYLGDEYARAVLDLINGRVKRYTDKFFGRT